MRDPFNTIIRQLPVLAEASIQIRSRYTQEWPGSITALAQHGDLCTDNVLLDRGNKCHVFDWETLGIIDLPYFDLITFLLSLSGGVMPGRWNATLRRQAQHLIAQYSGALGLNPADLVFMAPLLLANWVDLQIISERKAVGIALRAFEDCLANPHDWQQVLLG